MEKLNLKSIIGFIIGLLFVIWINFGCSTDNSSSNTGRGGYDMPNSGDTSVSDYIKRVDPELYNDMRDRYNDMTQ